MLKHSPRETHTVVQDTRALYFVLDVTGSCLDVCYRGLAVADLGAVKSTEPKGKRIRRRLNPAPPRGPFQM